MRDPVELIRQYCRDDDADAFREFYRAQSPRLWKFLVARGCHSEDAYELVSEAFLRFFQNVCRDPRAPVAFLFRVAAHLRIDALRREHARPTQPLTVEIPSENDPRVSEQIDYVHELIARLPGREQNLLLLRYGIGLNHHEVALALNLPEGTVRRQCAEVIAKLRDQWRKDEAASSV